jgi:nitroreductase
MDFDKVIRQRKMIREYIANKQIPEKMITRLIKNTRSAPSAGHSQVQEFIVVKDDITTAHNRYAKSRRTWGYAYGQCPMDHKW